VVATRWPSPREAGDALQGLPARSQNEVGAGGPVMHATFVTRVVKNNDSFFRGLVSLSI
jgi:hypothetical protein